MKKVTKTTTCLNCNAEFEAEVRMLMGRDVSTKCCSDCREALEEIHRQEEADHLELGKQRIRDGWRRAAKIPPRFADETFARWEQRGWRRHTAYKTVRDWVEEFPADPVGYPSLVLYSEHPGHGKTTLAACVANHLIDRWDGNPELPYPVAPVRYETGPGLGIRIRASYNLNAQTDGLEERDLFRETEASIYQGFNGPPLLILDDVGDSRKEPATDHTARVYFQIINQRYQANLPLLLITNSRGQTLVDFMGQYAVDRIHEMAGGKWLSVPGRTRAAKASSNA